MDSYSYKSNKKSLPILAKATSTGFYTTFYSGTRTISNTPTETNFFRDKIFKQTTPYNTKPNRFYTSKQRVATTDKSRKKRKRLKMYLQTQAQFDTSDAETDDTIFAISVIKNMDDMIAKRINKNLIWKRKVNNIYDICSSKNRKDIKDIQTKVRENNNNYTFDLHNEIKKNKYIPDEKKKTIKDATDIMNRMKINMMNEKKSNFFNQKYRIDLHTFTKQNRDICLKNILINLIKNERNIISTKEYQITKALEDAYNNFMKDTSAFNEFTINQKRQFREKEKNLEESIKTNKILIEQLKKLNSEIHGTQEEIEKNVNDIILYKYYGSFIINVLGSDVLLKGIKLTSTSPQNKDKDMETTINNIFNEFNFILNDKNIPEENKEILNDPEILYSLFVTIESNIIQTMNERDDVIKERIRNKIEYEKELTTLKNKLISEEKDLVNLTNEIILRKNIITPSNDYKKIIDENDVYIYDIYQELTKALDIKNKPHLNLDLCQETLDLLHTIEDKVIYVFDEMDKIVDNEKDKEPDETFKNILDKVKLDNKFEKYKESRIAMMKLEEEKNLKYQQRMNRYKINGPITYPPPWVYAKKKHDKNKIKKKVDNDDDIIYY